MSEKELVLKEKYQNETTLDMWKRNESLYGLTKKETNPGKAHQARLAT